MNNLSLANIRNIFAIGKLIHLVQVIIEFFNVSDVFINAEVIISWENIHYDCTKIRSFEIKKLWHHNFFFKSDALFMEENPHQIVFMNPDHDRMMLVPNSIKF